MVGYSTQYLGHLTIEPPLNEHEVEWLRAYAACAGPGRGRDPYDIPMNPRAGPTVHDDGRANMTDEALVPFGFCDFEPTVDGNALVWMESDKSNHAREWLPYLIDTFLRPGATAATSGREVFERFTFDHVVNGAMAAYRELDGRLFLHVVDDNDCHRLTISSGEPLPYELRPYADYGEEGQDGPAHLARVQDLARVHGVMDTGPTSRYP